MSQQELEQGREMIELLTEIRDQLRLTNIMLVSGLSQTQAEFVVDNNPIKRDS